MSDAQQRFGSGRSVLRIEDDLLLRGQGRYTDDLPPEPGLEPPLRVCFVRSAYPHARIRSIDARAARALPGVVAVYTGADLVAAGVRPMAAPTGFRRVDGPHGSPERWPLAVERVRHVGEALAMVVAGTLEQARDAAEALEVDLEEQPMVVDLSTATAAGAPRVSDGLPDNIAAEKRYGDAVAVRQAFERAAHRVRLRIVNQRLAALTLEPRSVMAFVDPADGRLTLRMSTQMPSGIRQALSKDVLGIPRDRIRVTVGDVGGGFGLKGGMHPEDAAVAWAAWTLRRPVKWIAERSEEFLSAATGRDLDSDAELALDERGRILALRLATLANVGAYATPTGVAIALMIGPWVQTSVYDIARVDFHFKAVMTHTAPVGAYRGAGRPEAIHIMERLIDEAARQTGLDRIALRRINLITPQQMPYTNPMAQVYDSGRFERVMDQALALADWQGFGLRERHSRQAGRWRGLGIATFLEWTGGNVFEERVTVRVRPEGVIEVFSAVNGMGQGIATSLAQLVVDVFDVPLSAVRIVMGDTDRGDGFGSAGSRSIFVGGSAVRVGSERALDQARERAAAHLEAAVADLEYQGGRFQVRGTDLGVGLFELAAAEPGSGGIYLESTSSVGGPSWPNGCHICEVEVDPQTGEVAVQSYASVNDVGRVISPTIVVGQLDGGAVQGIGQALWEQVVYDPASGQLLTGSLMDYAAPRADQVPDFVTRMDPDTPCLNNPLGVKGVGELGTIGATPCVVNAVADALARNGHAHVAPHLQMPLTPARLWQALQRA